VEKGYLFILIGAVFAATLHVPMPFQIFFWWNQLTFWGFLFVSLGMRQIMGTEKELRYAQFFTMLTLLLRLGIPWISNIFPSTLVLALDLSLAFSSLAIFFWLFKSEYLWSPSSTKRMDWYIYSAIALIYLVLKVALMLPMVVSRISLSTFMTLLDAIQFVNLLYNIVLVGLLVKLYLAAKNDTGLTTWN